MSAPLLIGVSFGTVYSSISILGKDGKNAETIANEDGDRQIPSYVAFTEHEELCGTQAAVQAMANPNGTVLHFRNILGKQIDDEEVQHQSRKHRFTITEAADGSGLPVYEITLAHEDGEDRTNTYSVVDVSAKFLRKIKETAEYFLSQKVDGCVISIPPHFEDAQKQALLEATKLAGFSIAYPLHEPVAAVLAYEAAAAQLQMSQSQQSLDARANGKLLDRPDKQIVVLDLGAHQFNVTVLSSHDGLYTIEASIDEPELGGISFTELLVEFVRLEFKRKYKADISDNRRAMEKLRNAVERTKRALTRQDTAPCSVESLYDGLDYNGTINRGRFEMLAEPLYARCRDTVGRALREADVAVEQVDEVLVVGGSSRMPRFQAVMKSLFAETTEFRVDVEPDEAISLGCAVQAGIILGSTVDYAALASNKDVVTADHLSKSIGIEIAGGAFAVVIPRGTPLPVRRTVTFGLSSSGQTEAYIAVYEGEAPVAKKNAILAEVVLSDLATEAPEGRAAVDLTLTVEKDHTLSVAASEKKSGQHVNVRVK
ncbi:Hsp70 protein that interacts with Zuo1p [Polyrhizophydium stewartii]|uniref:Hsp70 protein that interacts with Zuo1p n=1 Tax=Polyrhizophydium stewartii TaxID=2732419 RepID=A0ABR4NC85_9FUNG|nr:hypothetical protein HK105_001855 [Polyrhizophydium stewartii]